MEKKITQANIEVDDIMLMHDGGSIFIDESDYGFGEVFKIYDTYILFLIPMYGGEPSFDYATTSRIDMIDRIKNIN